MIEQIILVSVVFGLVSYALYDTFTIQNDFKPPVLVHQNAGF